MNGMFWFQLVVIVALLAAVGWLAVGGGGHMSEAAADRPDLALPRDGLLDRRDVDRVRFSVGARGYRMDEVDDVLDRLAHEIDLRERRIAELEGRAPAEGENGDGYPAGDYSIAAPAPAGDDYAGDDYTVTPPAQSGDDEATGSADAGSTRPGDSAADA